MTTAFDPLVGILTAICVLFLSGVVVGFVGGWLGHWWSAQHQVPCAAGAAYDADVHEESAYSIHDEVDRIVAMIPGQGERQ